MHAVDYERPAEKIAIIGAGNYGTALYYALSEDPFNNNRKISLFDIPPDEKSGIEPKNLDFYLQFNRMLPKENISLHIGYENLEEAVYGADLIIYTAASKGAKETAENLVGKIGEDVPIFTGAKGLTKLYVPEGAYSETTSKGIERFDIYTVSEMLEHHLNNNPIGAFGGLSFAKQILSGTPTFVDLALNYTKLRHDRKAILGTTADTLNISSLEDPKTKAQFHAHIFDNILWVEAGGFLKNSYVLATGYVKGKYGSNADNLIKALVTYIPNEMYVCYTKLTKRNPRPLLDGLKRRAYMIKKNKQKAMMRFSWLTDLIGCEENSRNYLYAMKRGEGKTHEEAVQEVFKKGIGITIEGIEASKNTLKLIPEVDYNYVPLLLRINQWFSGQVHDERAIQEVIKIVNNRYRK